MTLESQTLAKSAGLNLSNPGQTGSISGSFLRTLEGELTMPRMPTCGLEAKGRVKSYLWTCACLGPEEWPGDPTLPHLLGSHRPAKAG